MPAVYYNWYTKLRKVLNFILVDEVINMSRIKHSATVSTARQGNTSWPPLVNELPACTCRLKACFAIKCTRSASNCCNCNVKVSFFSYFCLDQGDVFDEVTTTIEVQDENNNRPVFIQNIFVGGEDIAVSRPFNVTLQTSVNGKVFDRSSSLNRDLKIRRRRRQRERHKSNKFN